MQIYLAAAPDRLGTVRRYALPPAHAAYRIGPDGRLASLPLPPSLRGGLLMLTDRGAPDTWDPALLCRDLVWECRRRSAIGVVLDFLSPPNASSARFAALLDGELQRQQRRFYVPVERRSTTTWFGCSTSIFSVHCSISFSCTRNSEVSNMDLTRKCAGRC